MDISITSLVLLLACTVGHGGIIRRFNYDARLYEHFAYDSRYIQYSRTEPEGWKNLTMMVESRNYSFVSMICTAGPGAWLFYPDPMYMMGNSQRYYLVIGEHCVRSDDFESIQPLGKVDELLDQGVLLFSEPQFGAAHTLVMEGSGSGDAKSLIFTGPKTFLISGGSEKICLTPGITEYEYGLCLIQDLKASFNMEGSITVKEDCEGEGKTVIVQKCYMEGVHELYNDMDLTVAKQKEICAGSGDDFSKSKFAIVTELWGRRLGAQIPKRPDDIRAENEDKVTLIWSVLEIFKTSCPAVEELYIYLVGHLFVMHMKHYWRGDNVTEMDPDDWKFAGDFIEKFCAGQIDEVPVFPSNCKTGDEFNRMAENSWYEVENGDDFDPVIEQMWIIFNFIVPSCSQATGYTTNDWSDLVLFFHQAFLEPLQDIWAEPGDWRRIYTAVFHGYDIREEHSNILDCLSGTLAKSPDFDPIGRPKKFRDYVYYKYQLPGHGEIDNPSNTISKPPPAPSPKSPPPATAKNASPPATPAPDSSKKSGTAKKAKRQLPKSKDVQKLDDDTK